MEHFSDEKIQSMEDETELIRNMEKDFDKPVFLEKIRFKLSDKHYVDDFNSFLQYVGPVLPEWQVAQVRTITGDFIRDRFNAMELFNKFWTVFGPILVYKYFFLYSVTVNRRDQRHQLEAALSYSLRNLPFRHPNSVINLESWEDFFSRIRDVLFAEVQRRIESNEIDVTKSYRMHKERFFQLTGSVREARFQDLIHWKYLNNFLENVDGKIMLQRAILAPVDKIHHLMGNFTTMDLLVCFTYFELAMTKMDGEKRKFRPDFPANPNLLKFFMRKNVKVANSLSYEIKSDAEDYREGGAEKTPTPAKIVQAHRLFKELIKEHADVKKEKWDRFNGGKIGGGQGKPGVAYENDASIQSKIEESFPALEGGNEEGSIFDRMNGKKKSGRVSGKVSGQKKVVQKGIQPVINDHRLARHPLEDSPPRKKQNFALKMEPETEEVPLQLFQKNKNVDFDRDFPALDPSSSSQTFTSTPSMKFTKPTPTPSSKVVIPKSTPSVVQREEEAFPSLETEPMEESLFARMQNHKPIAMPKMQTKQAKGSKKQKAPKAPQQSILDRQIEDHYVERNKKQSGRIQIDHDYYFNDRNNEEEEDDQPVVIPPPREEPVQVKPRNIGRAEFPDLSGPSHPQEADLFDRMKVTKRSQMEELSAKFGYQPVGGGSAGANVAVGSVKKKKR